MMRSATIGLLLSVALVPLLACSTGDEDGTESALGGSGTGNGGAGAAPTGGSGGTGTGGTGTGGAASLPYEFLIVDRDGQIQGYEADDGSLTLLPLGIDLEWFGTAIIGDGHGAFMAVGGKYDASNSAAAVYSPDGVSWIDVSPEEALAPDLWGYVAYGNERFVASAHAGDGFFFSEDHGATWTASATTSSGGSVIFGDGRFVAADGHYSTDGDTWTAPSTPPNALSSAVIAFGAGRFVITGDPASGSATYYSDDGGETWTAGDMTNNHYNGFFGATYGNGRFVAADHYDVVYSDDGASWADASVPSTEITTVGLAFHPAAGFIRVSGLYYNSEIWTSADGITWTCPGGTITGQWFFNVTATE